MCVAVDMYVFVYNRQDAEQLGLKNLRKMFQCIMLNIKVKQLMRKKQTMVAGNKQNIITAKE